MRRIIKIGDKVTPNVNYKGKALNRHQVCKVGGFTKRVWNITQQVDTFKEAHRITLFDLRGKFICNVDKSAVNLL